MLAELDVEGAKVGLKINKEKTKFMATENLKYNELKLNDSQIEKADRYVHLEEGKLNNDNHGDISRRQKATWKKPGEMPAVLSLKFKPEVRKSLFNTTILKAFAYGSESWGL